MQENHQNHRQPKSRIFGRSPKRNTPAKSDRRPSSFQQSITYPQYVEELDKRLSISIPVASGSDENGIAALFFDEISGFFTVVQKDNDQEVSNIFDTIAREQWGGNVLVIGHKKLTVDGFIASGHISIRGSNLRIKFANERSFDCVIDPNTPCLSPFHLPAAQQSLVRLPSKGPVAKRAHPHQNSRFDSEKNRADSDINLSNTSDEDDFTEEDLRRLRGEISLESSANQSHQPHKNRFR
jgi:hypothetical protein